MAYYYVDFLNGTDWTHANSGKSWDTAYKTLSGITVRITGITLADTVRIAKTPDPVSTGINAKWTGTYTVAGAMEAAKSIVATSNTTPIQVTATTHGYSNGDQIHLYAHTTNLSANGYWIITGVTTSTFQLVGSKGMATGGAAGSVLKINPKVVLLDEPLTKNIHNCEYYSATINNWTPGTNVTSSNLTTTIWKEGYSAVSINCAAGVGSGQTLAKSALPESLDLSAYSGISFWFRNCNNATIAAGALQIKLYSDSGCSNEVESFTLPQIGVVLNAIYTPIEINKGSALSSTVQGIALYSTTVEKQTSRIFLLDNIIAIRGPSDPKYLCHRSLISKNGAAQINSGNTEGWFPIKAINEKIVVIDNNTECYSNVGRGYWGATENVPLYTRMPVSVYDNSNSTLYLWGRNFNIEFGHNTGTTIIDGECWFDSVGRTFPGMLGTYSNAYGFIGYVRGVVSNLAIGNSDTKGYYENLSIIGGGCAWYANGLLMRVKNIWNFTNNGTGFVVATNGWGTIIDKIWNTNNNLGVGLNNSAVSGVIYNCYNINNNSTGGLLLYNCLDTLTINNIQYNGYGIVHYGTNVVYIKETIYKNTSAFAVASGAIINGCNTLIISGNTFLLNNNIPSIIVNNGTAVLKNILYYQPMVYAIYNNNQSGIAVSINNIIYGEASLGTGNNGNTITQDTGTTISGNNSWKMSVRVGDARQNPIFMAPYTPTTGLFPLKLKIAKVYVAANLSVTVSAYMKMSSTTAIGGKLYMEPYQLSGLTEKLETYCSSTDWTKITLPTFTPLEAGVIEIEARAWHISSLTDSVWVDSLEVIQ